MCIPSAAVDSCQSVDERIHSGVQRQYEYGHPRRHLLGYCDIIQCSEADQDNRNLERYVYNIICIFTINVVHVVYTLEPKN